MSSYVDRIIQPGEQVIATGRMHWIVYVRGLGLMAIGIVVMLLPLGSGWGLVKLTAGIVVVLFGFFSFARAWIEAWTTEVAVTNRRVIQKRGLISRRTGEMNMEKVKSVTVDQSLLGRVLNYGSLVIRGTGAGIEGLHHIANPLELRSAIVVR